MDNRNTKEKLELKITLAIDKLKEVPRNSPCACKSNMQKLLLLNEITQYTVEYTTNFGGFSYFDCRDIHRRGESIADNVTDVIVCCIRTNNDCEDPLHMRSEISSLCKF